MKEGLHTIVGCVGWCCI